MSTDNISIGDKLDISKFNLIYCMDYWDYPLTGVCEYDGNLCYFKFIGDVMVANDEMPYAHDTSILPEIQYDVTNLYMVIKLNPVTMKKLVRYNEHFAMWKFIPGSMQRMFTQGNMRNQIYEPSKILKKPSESLTEFVKNMDYKKHVIEFVGFIKI